MGFQMSLYREVPAVFFSKKKSRCSPVGLQPISETPKWTKLPSSSCVSSMTISLKQQGCKACTGTATESSNAITCSKAPCYQNLWSPTGICETQCHLAKTKVTKGQPRRFTTAQVIHRSTLGRYCKGILKNKTKQALSTVKQQGG